MEREDGLEVAERGRGLGTQAGLRVRPDVGLTVDERRDKAGGPQGLQCLEPDRLPEKHARARVVAVDEDAGAKGQP